MGLLIQCRISCQYGENFDIVYFVYWSFYQELVELEFLQDQKIHKIKSLVINSHYAVCDFAMPVVLINKKTLHLLILLVLYRIYYMDCYDVAVVLHSL